MPIAVLVSGGVDSSVALARLVEEGREVHAFYLKVWLEDELQHLGRCPWEEDLRFVRAVTERLGVRLTVIPLQRAYRERVVAYLIAELERGGTPSPDLFCNARIKFGAFPEWIDERIGDWVDAEIPRRRFERVATGHYALRAEGRGGVELRRGADPVKDQTYFLSRISEGQLERALFPVGGLQKTAVRQIARRLGLAPQDRRDSQGICFLGGVRYRDFVRAHLGERPGAVVDEATGDEIGRHRGHWLFTVGQRRGFGLSGGPWFVAAKDPASNRVLVRRGAGRPTRRFRVGDLHWIGSGAPGEPERLQLRVRHAPELAGALFGPQPDGSGEVLLDEPDRGIAPGQFAVFYRGARCLGSGRILPGSGS